MRNFKYGWSVLFAAPVAAAACASSGPVGSVPLGTGDPQIGQQRLADFRAEGADASITVFPVILWDGKKPKEAGDLSRDAAGVVGVLLERAGMNRLEPSDDAFVLAADVDFDVSAEPFGDFVRENPIESDYALYAEIVGSGAPPRIDEVRAVIVDRDGRGVWIDRLTENDRDFKWASPDCPMDCCVLMTKRLSRLLGLRGSPRRGGQEGRFTKRAAERSSLPSAAEEDAMEDRLAAMRKHRAGAELVVFPVFVGGDTVDSDRSAELGTLLTKEKLCTARPTRTSWNIEPMRTHNELKALWDTARRFRDRLKEQPLESGYGLYAQYMFSPRDGRVMAVHFIVCAADGDWVIVDMQNDHHGDFQSIDPRTADDCDRLVARRLASYLR